MRNTTYRGIYVYLDHVVMVFSRNPLTHLKCLFCLLNKTTFCFFFENIKISQKCLGYYMLKQFELQNVQIFVCRNAHKNKCSGDRVGQRIQCYLNLFVKNHLKTLY